MQTSSNTAQILDLNAFRQQRQESAPGQQAATPMLMWYPVWVMVPNPTPPIT